MQYCSQNVAFSCLTILPLMIIMAPVVLRNTVTMLCTDRHFICLTCMRPRDIDGYGCRSGLNCDIVCKLSLFFAKLLCSLMIMTATVVLRTSMENKKRAVSHQRPNLTNKQVGERDFFCRFFRTDSCDLQYREVKSLRGFCRQF